MSIAVAPEMPERSKGGYRPEEPIQLGPLYSRPLRWLPILRWFFGLPGYFFPWQALFVCLAAATWDFLKAASVPQVVFSARSVGLVVLLNAVLLTAFVGAWHFLLYVRRKQGALYKYNPRWLAIEEPSFLFRRQLWDNVFWNLGSAVPIWTIYELTSYAMQGARLAPTASWDAHPIYCTALLVLIPTWLSIHFYGIHRLIHWAPLYRAVHYLHHKNINFGPWSGLAMHPVEHALYFSAVLILWIIPSHPIHVLYLLVLQALGPTLDHHGFARVFLGKSVSVDTDHYMHYLHHKYFEVNYGTDVGVLPLDKWCGTFYDGSAIGRNLLKRRGRIRPSGHG